MFEVICVSPAFIFRCVPGVFIFFSDSLLIFSVDGTGGESIYGGVFPGKTYNFMFIAQ